MWDESVDFLVVGSGGGALCAAMTARAQGASVLVLEKTDKIGGSTAMSGGVLWIPNSTLMKREGVSDSLEAARSYLDAVIGEDAGPGSTTARREAFLESAPKVVTFLEGCGMQFIRADGWSDYHDELPGGSERGRSIGTPLLDSKKLGKWWSLLRLGPFPAPLTVAETRFIGEGTRTFRGRFMVARMAWRMLWQRITGRRLLGLGTALQGRMILAADRLQVPIRPNAGVTKLVQEGGRVTGVVATIDGREKRIEAKAGVLIASGGFARNAEMRKSFGPQPSSDKWTNANPGETGEMLLAAQAVGADLAMLDEAWWIPISMPPNAANVSMHSTDIAKPHVILVDAAGQRFTNEAGSYVDNGHAMYARNKTVQAVPAWAILDSRHRSRYNWAFSPPLITPEAWFSSGYFKKSDTLEDLARQCGIDAAGLAATVKRFNGFAAKGVDEDFHRGARAYDRSAGDPTVAPNPNLGAIDKPPFYACAIFPGDVGTQGGVVADEFGRALTPEGKVIPGLYATGNCTAPVFGRVYPGAGASIAASFVFGFLAAEHACGGGRSSGISSGRTPKSVAAPVNA